MHKDKPPAKKDVGCSIPDWIDDGEYVDLDINDPEVQARYDDFVRRRNHPLEAATGRGHPS